MDEKGSTDTGGNQGPLSVNPGGGLMIDNPLGDNFVPNARDYQQGAIDHMMGFGNTWLDACSSLHPEIKNTINNALRKELLLEMATGSGKTYTVANIINTFFYARENLIKKLKSENNHELAEKLQRTPVKILVLSHQIAITDQHKKVFMDGEMDGEKQKLPLLCNDLRNNCRVSVLHSKVKKVQGSELMVKSLMSLS